MLLSLAAPADNQRGPRYMQEALAALHQANHGRLPVTLEYRVHDGLVGLYCRVPDDLESLVVGLFAAKYPNCTVTRFLSEEAPPRDRNAIAISLRLVPDLFPILRHSQFEDIQSGTFSDPIDALLQSIQSDEHTQARIEIHAAPVSHHRHRWARHAVGILDDPVFRRHSERASRYARWIMHPWLWPLGWLLGLAAAHRGDRMQRFQIETTAGRHHEREDDMQAASDKVGGHLFDARIRLVVYAAQVSGRAVTTRLRQISGAFGSFTVSRLATFQPMSIGRISNLLRRGDFLLSHEELATLWHPPTSSVSVTQLRTTEFRELDAPANLHVKESEGAVLGRVKFRNDVRLVVLGAEDRRRHLYVVGKTGMGKTTLLENQISADIQAGRGVCLIDPHGDLADRVTAAIPSGRTNDVILFDPSDDEFAVAYNPLACFAWDHRDLVADNVLSAFAKVYDLAHTPRLKDTLRNALYILIEKDMTLLDLLVFFADHRFRRQALVGVDDEVARLFWEVEFPSWNERYRTEALSAVQNKVRPFLMNKRIRAIVGQRRKPLNLRQIMDDGNVLIVNLSKGKIGEENSALLGAFLVSSLQQAAMSRAEVPENERRDFYLYIDEFQNFTTSSFATILSEARKYRLNLTVAHQYLKQLDEMTADAVFGNVGSIVSFQVGSDDAEVLSRQLAKYEGQLTNRDLTNLPRFTAYARLLLEGLPSNPFSLQTLMPAAPEHDRSTAVRDASRRQYGQPLSAVRQRIRDDLFAKSGATFQS